MSVRTMATLVTNAAEPALGLEYDGPRSPFTAGSPGLRSGARQPRSVFRRAGRPPAPGRPVHEQPRSVDSAVLRRVVVSGGKLNTVTPCGLDDERSSDRTGTTLDLARGVWRLRTRDPATGRARAAMSPGRRRAPPPRDVANCCSSPHFRIVGPTRPVEVPFQ